jgi:hypothetical protein
MFLAALAATHFIGLGYSSTSQAFCTYAYPYHHARHLRLKKVFYIPPVTLYSSPLEVPAMVTVFCFEDPWNSYSRPRWQFRSYNRRTAVSEATRLKISRLHAAGIFQRPHAPRVRSPFGCNDYVTAVAVGKPSDSILVS